MVGIGKVEVVGAFDVYGNQQHLASHFSGRAMPGTNQAHGPYIFSAFTQKNSVIKRHFGLMWSQGEMIQVVKSKEF